MIRKEKIKRGRYWAIRVNDTYIFEHRLVMEKKLKRKLFAKEIIHHINGNPEDNRPENLEIFTSPGQHLQHHRPDLKDRQKLIYKGQHFSVKTEWKKGDHRLIGNTYGFKKGQTSWNKGKTASDELRKKLSIAHQGKHTANAGSFKKGFIPWNKGLLGWKKNKSS